MSAFGWLYAVICEYCDRCGIPLLIYGDWQTAQKWNNSFPMYTEILKKKPMTAID